MSPVAAEDDGAPRPTYPIGYVWPLAERSFALVRIEDGVYVFVAPGAEIRLTKTLGFLGARRGDEYLELTTDVALPWPLKPGEWGAIAGGWRASRPNRTFFGGRSMQLSPDRLIWQIEGYEDVPLATGRHRDAAPDACGGLRCAPASRPLTD